MTSDKLERLNRIQHDIDKLDHLIHSSEFIIENPGNCNVFVGVSGLSGEDGIYSAFIIKRLVEDFQQSCKEALADLRAEFNKE